LSQYSHVPTSAFHLPACLKRLQHLVGTSLPTVDALCPSIRAGTLKQHPTKGEVKRSQVQALLESMGATLLSSVSGQTDFVVVGEDPGANKMAAAAKKGIRVMQEAEFWQELGGRGWSPDGGGGTAGTPPAPPAAAGAAAGAMPGGTGKVKGVVGATTTAVQPSAAPQAPPAPPPAPAAGGKPRRRSRVATAATSTATSTQQQQQQAVAAAGPVAKQAVGSPQPATGRPLVGGLFPEGSTVTLLGEWWHGAGPCCIPCVTCCEAHTLHTPRLRPPGI
jgi:hypothetical protein